MLMVSGTLEIGAGDIDRARQAALVMMAETQKEDGCLVYEFSQVIGSEGRFRIYEEWRDMAALGAHGQSGHMKEFRAALDDLDVMSRDIWLMEAGRKKPL